VGGEAGRTKQKFSKGQGYIHMVQVKTKSKKDGIVILRVKRGVDWAGCGGTQKKRIDTMVAQ